MQFGWMGQPFTSCVIPVVYDRLSRDVHELTARAIDDACMQKKKMNVLEPLGPTHQQQHQRLPEGNNNIKRALGSFFIHSSSIFFISK
jgi:hypothetical protein